MSRSMKVFAMAAVAGLAASAQAGGGPGGPPMGGPGGPGGPGGHGMDGKAAAMVLVRAADADRSHDVTADEWSAFLASLTSGDAGVVSLDSLAAALPVPPNAPAEIDAARRDAMLTRAFDADADGVVTLDDLGALFAALDTNGDGAISEDDRPAPGEMPPPGEGHHGPKGPPPGAGDGERPACRVGDAGKAAALLARAADADESGDATADEFAALLDSLGADEAGAVSLDALADALGAPETDDTTERDARLVRTFDFDGDGVVTTADLQSFFDGADRDDDGVAEKGELRGPRRVKGGDRRAAARIFRVVDGDRSRDVTADEWAAFLASLEADESGAVSLDALAAQLPAGKRGGADTTKRDAMLVRAFDQDGDGVVTLADLQSLFDRVDADASGSLETTELKPRR